MSEETISDAIIEDEETKPAKRGWWLLVILIVLALLFAGGAYTLHVKFTAFQNMQSEQQNAKLLELQDALNTLRDAGQQVIATAPPAPTMDDALLKKLEMRINALQQNVPTQNNAQLEAEIGYFHQELLEDALRIKKLEEAVSQLQKERTRTQVAESSNRQSSQLYALLLLQNRFDNARPFGRLLDAFDEAPAAWSAYADTPPPNAKQLVERWKALTGNAPTQAIADGNEATSLWHKTKSALTNVVRVKKVSETSGTAQTTTLPNNDWQALIQAIEYTKTLEELEDDLALWLMSARNLVSSQEQLDARIEQELAR